MRSSKLLSHGTMHALVMFGVTIAVVSLGLSSCKHQNTEKSATDMQESLPSVRERLAAWAPIDIAADLSVLSPREREMVGKLVEAARLVDEVFWQQTAPDAIALRDSLAAATTDEGRELYRYLMINYGPYDRIHDGLRFVGTGPEKKPAGANFYPQDLTREEFEAYVASHPEQRAALEGQYSIVRRAGGWLETVPYHRTYPQIEAIARKLDEAAALCDNPSLKRYLTLRAKAIRTDDYYESDMAWMDIRDNNVDVVIGPIENYEDALFNYRTAYECAVVVKDPEGTRELQMFTSHIDAFEQALPQDKKYTRATAGSGNILEVVNIVVFAGDFQSGVKTIAASLPNDPRVTQAKGGKKQMYRNMMEAKFEKIVRPIAERVLDPALLPHVDRHAFTSFVTLHEVSHTLGRGYVFGNDSLPVRRALKERYSAVEECKADVLGLYNNLVLLRENVITKDDLRRSMVTYVAGLIRSLRFGAEEAHGRANLVQLNYLREKGAITRTADGRYGIDETIFMDRLGDLGREVLELQAVGSYERAGTLLDRYGRMNAEITAMVEKVKDVPRDIDTRYTIMK